MFDDQDILNIYHEGGKEEYAFNLLVRKYSERLYWHIRQLVLDHEQTNDLLQNTLVKAWKYLPDFRGDSKLFTWLYRIATNEVLNYLRKKKLMSLISFGNISASMERKIDEDPSFNGDTIQRELHKAIQRLPEKQRLVFSLRYFDEMKYEDISEITGTSTGALKASYHHAYNKIKEELQKLI